MNNNLILVFLCLVGTLAELTHIRDLQTIEVTGIYYYIFSASDPLTLSFTSSSIKGDSTISVLLFLIRTQYQLQCGTLSQRMTRIRF